MEMTRNLRCAGWTFNVRLRTEIALATKLFMPAVAAPVLRRSCPQPIRRRTLGEVDPTLTNQAGFVNGDDPQAVPVGRSVPGAAAGGDDLLVDRQDHLDFGDANAT
jgi:hypothetical protein